MDVGRWLAKQRQHEVWDALMDGQRERLEQLGITPLTRPAEPETPVKPATAPLGAFERGVAALGLRQGARTGSVKVPRAHVEALPDGSEVKLGVFLPNAKSRRARLTADKVQLSTTHPSTLGTEHITPAHTPRPTRPNRQYRLSANQQHTRPAASLYTNNPPPSVTSSSPASDWGGQHPDRCCVRVPAAVRGRKLEPGCDRVRAVPAVRLGTCA